MTVKQEFLPGDPVMVTGLSWLGDLRGTVVETGPWWEPGYPAPHEPVPGVRVADETGLTAWHARRNIEEVSL